MGARWKNMADRTAVRIAYKYFVLHFHQFPFKVSIFRMSHDYCSVRIFHSQGKPQKSKSIVLVNSICPSKSRAELFPFGLESNLELLDLCSVDILSHLKSLPSYESRSRLSKLPNLQDLTLMKILFIQ